MCLSLDVTRYFFATKIFFFEIRNTVFFPCRLQEKRELAFSQKRQKTFEAVLPCSGNIPPCPGSSPVFPITVQSILFLKFTVYTNCENTRKLTFTVNFLRTKQYYWLIQLENRSSLSNCCGEKGYLHCDSQFVVFSQ